MNWKIQTFALFLGFTFLPTLAAGDTSAEVPSGSLVDLAKTDIEQTFRSFTSGTVRGTRTASLYGSVFRDCAVHFTFTVVSKDSSHTGWRVQDNGTSGRDCMRGHQNDRCTESSCDSLSVIVPRINAPADEALEVGIVTINPEADVADPNRVNFGSLSPAIHFRSTIASAQEEQSEADADHRSRIRRLREQVRTCRDDERELTIARSALRELVSEGDVNESAMERIKRELDRQEIRLLERKIRRADIDELGELADDVVQFARNHDDDEEEASDYATAAAHLMRTIASRMVRDRNADEDSFADARDVLESALELDGLSDTNVTRLEGYLNDLDVAETTFMCRSGDPFECQPAYQSLMSNLQQRKWEACTGWNIDPVRCQTAAMQEQRAPGQIQQYFTQRQSQIQQPGAGGTVMLAGGGGQLAFNGSPMGYQPNTFLPQSTMGLNPLGMSQYTGYDPTLSLVMNGSMPRGPMMGPTQLPVASI